MTRGPDTGGLVGDVVDKLSIRAADLRGRASLRSTGRNRSRRQSQVAPFEPRPACRGGIPPADLERIPRIFAPKLT